MLEIRSLINARIPTAAKLTGVFLVLFAEAVCLQFLGGAFSSDYGGFSDEAAHYVTALMVRDFLLSGDFSAPMRFAEDYYLFYPKVAIGNWPPVLYGVLGFWFIVFGASRISAMLFVAATAAATGTAIHRVAQSELNPLAGWFCAVLFIAVPLTQRSTGLVMLEHLVAFFTFLAAIFLAAFFRKPTISSSLAFGLIATLAIMTRGSAWSIGLMPGLSMLFMWRFATMKTWALWISAVPVLVVCVPWYLATAGMAQGAWTGSGLDLDFVANALPSFLAYIYSALGPVILISALIGVGSKLVMPFKNPSQPENPIWATCAAMIFATYVFHSIVPASIDARYMLPTLPGLLLFSAAGIQWTSDRLAAKRASLPASFALYILIIAAFGMANFNVQVIENGGYSGAVEKIASRFPGSPLVLLIDADSSGEGSVVAAAAGLEARKMLVLRGTKVLVQEDWLGRKPKERFGTPKEIADLLGRVPVDVVMLDDSIGGEQPRKYRALLRAVLQSENSAWIEFGRFPVVRAGSETPNALRVYVSDEIVSGGNRQAVNRLLIKSLNSRG
jgi:hypothetical protein